jgi:acyl-coenzyme A thioesterase PaaI-like protein
MRAHWLKLGMNLWPPFRGAGIRIVNFADDYRSVDVELRMGRLNRNYVGAHFGGSLYAMTDPFYTLMLIHLMGREYRVAHAGARIDFIAPAHGRVQAHFEINDEQINAIREAARDGSKQLPEFAVEVKDHDDKVVAHVTHIVYVRLKQRPASQPASPA